MIRTMFVFLLACTASIVNAAEYDVLVRKGTIYDGTGVPTYVADVAIRNDRVVANGDFEASTADLEIDANGLAVAPGFFNMMSHAHLSLLEDGRAMIDVLQGATFEVLSEISLSPLTKTSVELWSTLLSDEDVELTWLGLGEFLEIVEKKGVAPNFGTFVSAATRGSANKAVQSSR